MSRIFILSSNTSAEPYPVYPLGSAVVASALKDKGHKVLMFDFLAGGQSDKGLMESIKKFDPDYVGISVRNIDNVDSLTPESSWFLAQDLHLVRLIRKITRASIILGGPAFSIMPGEVMDYLDADYGVVGEGEKVICDLIEDLDEGRFVQKIVDDNSYYLKDSEMCPPLWDKELIEYYSDKSGIINLQTKRGCPYNCLYCTYPNLEGRRYRARDPRAVVEDISRLKDSCTVDTIFFTDSIFNDAEGLYLRLAEEILSAGINIRWSGFFRPRGLGRREIALLKESGLYAIESGTDAGCDDTLANLKKGFRFDDVIEFNRSCIEEEMPVAHYIMFGGPGETDESVKEGLMNIKQLEASVVFAFSGIRIFPGTGLQDRAIKDGIIFHDTSLLKPIYYFSPEVDPKRMNETIEATFKKRRELIFPPSDGQLKIQTMYKFGYRGLLWDMLTPFYKKVEKR
jgi:lipid biosynthesis B12-binding/radical SAM protein